MSYLEELLPVFRKGAKIRCKSWKAGEYIYIDKKGSVMTEKRNIYILDNVDFTSKYWELYQEPIDWEYIIKNKCLCQFWNPGEEDCVRGVLLDYYKDDNFKFISYRPRGCFKFCRPVRKDEVTFYEDAKK